MSKTRTPKPKTVDATAVVAQILTGAQAKAPAKGATKAPLTDAEKAAIRAKRYPAAEKAEAEKRAAKAEAKANPTPKPPKPVKEVVAFVAKSLPKSKVAHVLSLHARPTSGAALYAHTHAALHLLGMMTPECKPAPKASVIGVMGQRAVTYHLGENNMVDTADGLALTPAGYSKFKARGIDGKLANAYMNMFVTGDVSGTGRKQADLVQVGL